MVRKFAEAGALRVTWRWALEASGVMTWWDKFMITLMNSWKLSISQPR